MDNQKEPKELTSGYALCTTSTALGSVGLVLFFLPVLGIPLAGVGVLFGALALIAAAFGRQRLGWSISALVFCLVALSIDVAIIQGPVEGVRPHLATPRGWKAADENLYVAPPEQASRGAR